MSTEWKPGDVAMLQPGTSGHRIGLRFEGGWRTVAGLMSDDTDPAPESHRPLVVIDPEDREQVERLLAEYYTIISPHMERVAAEPSLVDDMQAALREFANPKPPKPEEPTGLGAVVEDVNYTRWTRVESGEAETRNPWYPAHDPSLQPAEWSDIAAVRVLSEGVQP